MTDQAQPFIAKNKIVVIETIIREAGEYFKTDKIDSLIFFDDSILKLHDANVEIERLRRLRNLHVPDNIIFNWMKMDPKSNRIPNDPNIVSFIDSGSVQQRASWDEVHRSNILGVRSVAFFDFDRSSLNLIEHSKKMGSKLQQAI